ncbi:hypothetical protein BpHYR1_023775 [Brachionus plicatilis]|uniref:Uncharacterized protein n=1 Tax=Brachionus plicatilis TaxID=10195 RepID=A0A3M7SMQ0_BRAPC|nr:hypothetical protein BpHYR1_023775 [Brachionus plicatilis]
MGTYRSIEKILLLVNDDTPTYKSKSHEYSSVLDLFIVSTNLGPSINSFFVLDDDLTINFGS